jgi:hypothetical protein
LFSGNAEGVRDILPAHAFGVAAKQLVDHHENHSHRQWLWLLGR